MGGALALLESAGLDLEHRSREGNHAFHFCAMCSEEAARQEERDLQVSG